MFHFVWKILKLENRDFFELMRGKTEQNYEEYIKNNIKLNENQWDKYRALRKRTKEHDHKVDYWINKKKTWKINLISYFVK